MISVSTPTDTRIMTVSVESANPKQAKEIADTVREAVSVQIKEIMSVDSVNTVEEGNLPTSPSSPNTMKNMMFGGILGFVIAAGIITLIYLLDDTIKTPEDLRKQNIRENPEKQFRRGDKEHGRCNFKKSKRN